MSSPESLIAFEPTLSRKEGGDFLEAIYACDPDWWCMWQSTVLALEHFRGRKAWWPSQGLLAHQLEWRTTRVLSIYGDRDLVKGHEIGLNVIEEHLNDQNVVFKSQHILRSAAERSGSDWHNYMHHAHQVNEIEENMLPGLVQFTKPGNAHIEFFIDLTETAQLRAIAKLGYEAVRVTTLSVNG